MRNSIILIFIGLMSFTNWGQSDSYSLWMGATFKKDLSKKTTLNIDQQTRTQNGLENIKSSFLEVGLKRDLWKLFSVKAQYRYTIKNNERNTRRFSLDAGVKWKYKPAHLTLKYRLRFQNASVSYTGQNFTFLRNRIHVGYKLSKKWDIYTEYESFFRFNQKNEFRNNRFGFGLNYRLTKHLKINGFYTFDHEFNVKNPENRNILGLQLKWSF